MKIADPQHGATNAMSLIAMTTGAASVALLMMFVGLFVTAISIGATTPADIQAAVDASRKGAMVVVKADRMHKHSRAMDKGHFRDALLREESGRPPVTWPERRALSAGRVMHTMAPAMSHSGWPGQAHPLYI